MRRSWVCWVTSWYSRSPGIPDRERFAKPTAWVAGWGMWAYSTVMVSLWPDRLALPYWTSVAGWFLLATSLLLMGYSLFINLPFKRTYVSREKGNLIIGGMYAMVRHPWVLCCT